ncbi:MAG: helix-turn-helix transcriptional regulator [Clostridia bacterium]|nr:helix-turn-helix transcriptional regulator [Clostridia bacterium]
MYEIFAALMKERGLTAYRVSMDTGVSQATLSDWKRGRSTPKLPKLQKLADYFGVSLEYMMGTQDADHNAPSAPPTDADLKYALFGSRDVDDMLLEDVKAFARFSLDRSKYRK